MEIKKIDNRMPRSLDVETSCNVTDAQKYTRTELAFLSKPRT